jgi:hypothetical protein
MARGSSSGSRSRSASTGRFVTARSAARKPRGTVTESTSGRGGGGPHARSAITGRYVTPQFAARHPGTTVTER